MSIVNLNTNATEYINYHYFDLKQQDKIDYALNVYDENNQFEGAEKKLDKIRYSFRNRINMDIHYAKVYMKNDYENNNYQVQNNNLNEINKYVKEYISFLKDMEQKARFWNSDEYYELVYVETDRSHKIHFTKVFNKYNNSKENIKDIQNYYLIIKKLMHELEYLEYELDNLPDGKECKEYFFKENFIHWETKGIYYDNLNKVKNILQNYKVLNEQLTRPGRKKLVSKIINYSEIEEEHYY